MYKKLKKILFRYPPERAHHMAMGLFRLGLTFPLAAPFIKSAYKRPRKSKPVELFGLTFPNKVGLAAGFDKDGQYINLLSQLAFGFLEFGTVTPRPQKGNPQPRLFRLEKDEALINRMGFNNLGVDHLVERLKKFNRRDLIIGGNIGKNKDTPNENAVDDYLICFQKLHAHVDYFVVNVSSPNTPNLRKLQNKDELEKILTTLQSENESRDVQRPILLKIAPDLTPVLTDDIIDLALSLHLDGLVVSNTTIDRDGLRTTHETLETIGNGGLSGKPLFDKSTALIQYISTKSEGRIPIIGVGGIDDYKTARAKLDAGASLVQIYTGFVYKGPALIRQLAQKL